MTTHTSAHPLAPNMEATRVAAVERQLLADEGPYHVQGRYFANLFDAERQRRWAAERTVAAADRAARWHARQPPAQEQAGESGRAA